MNTKQIVEDLKFTWGTKHPPVEETPLTEKEKQELKDKWNEITKYYGKEDKNNG